MGAYIIKHVLRAFPPSDRSGPYTEQIPMKGLPSIETHHSDSGLITIRLASQLSSPRAASGQRLWEAPPGSLCEQPGL